jgi:hypothetical protein
VLKYTAVFAVTSWCILFSVKVNGTYLISFVFMCLLFNQVHKGFNMSVCLLKHESSLY